MHPRRDPTPVVDKLTTWARSLLDLPFLPDEMRDRNPRRVAVSSDAQAATAPARYSRGLTPRTRLNAVLSANGLP